MMTMRERLLAPFHGVRPDRPAWVADLSYWYSAAESTNVIREEYRGHDGYKRLHADLGVCYYYDYTSHPFDMVFDGVDVVEQEAGAERRRQWRAPAGTLSEHWSYLKTAECWAHDEYAVKCESDLPILLDICRRVRYEPAFPEYTTLMEWVGEAGVPLAPVPRSPLPALLTDWCGVEQTVFFLADMPDTMRTIMDSIDSANDSAFGLAAAAPAELFHFCDNLDSSASTPYFRDYMKEYYVKRLRQIHDCGKYAVVHLDGRVRGLLPGLASCGFDGIESITPAPVGDVSVEELRTIAANPRTILWGGIPGAMFSHPWTDTQIRDHTMKLLGCLGGDGRLVVGSADQIPPNGHMEYCTSIAETVQEWARASW
jgi:hypothetical protein